MTTINVWPLYICDDGNVIYYRDKDEEAKELDEAQRAALQQQQQQQQADSSRWVSRKCVWKDDGIWCCMLWCGMIWYGMVWYGMVWYGIPIQLQEDQTNSNVDAWMSLVGHWMSFCLLHSPRIALSDELSQNWRHSCKIVSLLTLQRRARSIDQMVLFLHGSLFARGHF